MTATKVMIRTSLCQASLPSHATAEYPRDDVFIRGVTNLSKDAGQAEQKHR